MKPGLKILLAVLVATAHLCWARQESAGLEIIFQEPPAAADPAWLINQFSNRENPSRPQWRRNIEDSYRRQGIDLKIGDLKEKVLFGGDTVLIFAADSAAGKGALLLAANAEGVHIADLFYGPADMVEFATLMGLAAAEKKEMVRAKFKQYTSVELQTGPPAPSTDRPAAAALWGGGLFSQDKWRQAIEGSYRDKGLALRIGERIGTVAFGAAKVLLYDAEVDGRAGALLVAADRRGRHRADILYEPADMEDFGKLLALDEAGKKEAISRNFRTYTGLELGDSASAGTDVQGDDDFGPSLDFEEYLRGARPADRGRPAAAAHFKENWKLRIEDDYRQKGGGLDIGGLIDTIQYEFNEVMIFKAAVQDAEGAILIALNREGLHIANLVYEAGDMEDLARLLAMDEAAKKETIHRNFITYTGLDLQAQYSRPSTATDHKTAVP